jgi:hypothetical protein
MLPRAPVAYATEVSGLTFVEAWSFETLSFRSCVVAVITNCYNSLRGFTGHAVMLASCPAWFSEQHNPLYKKAGDTFLVTIYTWIGVTKAFQSGMIPAPQRIAVIRRFWQS